MLQGIRQRIITAIATCILITLLLSPSVFAAVPHEDPETAPQIFSGVSFLRYYVETLDFILKKEPKEVEARLRKMPFANLPKNLRDSTNKFASSGIDISYWIANIDQDISKIIMLAGEFRFSESIEVIDKAFSGLSRAYEGVEKMKEAIEVAGKEFAVVSAPLSSDLWIAYTSAVYVTHMAIEPLLDSYEKPLSELRVLMLNKVTWATELTLKIEPLSAFVGDTITFEGALSSQGRASLGSEITILFDGLPKVTVLTGDNGFYQGSLTVPPLYTDQIAIQAMYSRWEKDAGFYISSVSKVVKLKVLFYKADITLGIEGNAYPGQEKEIHGRFDYGQAPVPGARKVEFYLDNIPVGEALVKESFTQKIKIKPEVIPGNHTLTVSAGADGRYAPVAASFVIDIKQAIPTLALDMTWVVFVPGNLSLAGKLWSDLGPLNGAAVNAEVGKSQIEMMTQEDGSFQGKMSLGMAMNLIGSRDFSIQVFPQEPWNAPVSKSKKVLEVNLVNSGIMILLIVLFRRAFIHIGFRRILLRYGRRRIRPELAVALAEPAPAGMDNQPGTASIEISHQPVGSPKERIIYLYKLLLRLIQWIAKKLLEPHHTLREFAKENSQILGPFAEYFWELTRMVEKIIYSRYIPQESDVSSCKQLSSNIEEELKKSSG